MKCAEDLAPPLTVLSERQHGLKMPVSNQRFIVGALLGVCVNTAGAAVGQTIAVVDPRPLAEAVLTVEKRCACAITYEDPPYEAKDAVDVTASVSRNPTFTRGVLIPKGGYFSFPYDLPPGAPPEHMRNALQQILVTYHLSGYPGNFR